MPGIRNPLSAALFLLVAAVLSACGGGGGGDKSDTGTLSIGITDAAFEDVDGVFVRFTGVTLKPANGGQIYVPVNPAPEPSAEPGLLVDLMQLQGGAYEFLLEGEVIPAGDYNWVALEVAENDPGMLNNMWVLTKQNTLEPLEIPSGTQSGLRLVSGFTILANQSFQLMIDWDLKKALVKPQNYDPTLDGPAPADEPVEPQPDFDNGVWKLRPALRITDMAQYGRIEGTVDPSLFMGAEDCDWDETLDTGNAVYAFRVPEAATFQDVVVDDIDGDDRDGENPYATAVVKWDGLESYSYAFDYMGIGDYKLAFTCEAGLDVIDENNNIERAVQLEVEGETFDPAITLIGDDSVDFTVLNAPVSVTNTEGNGQTTMAPEFQ